MSASLYRMHDAEGTLLYVGICAQPRRLDEHRQDKDWWGDVDRITVEQFDDRESARAAERRAIVAEAPVHNIQHRPKPPVEPTGRVRSTAAIGQRLRELREGKGWSREVLARKSDTAALTILRAEVHGSDPAASTLLAWADALDVTVSELVGQPTAVDLGDPLAPFKMADGTVCYLSIPVGGLRAGDWFQRRHGDPDWHHVRPLILAGDQVGVPFDETGLEWFGPSQMVRVARTPERVLAVQEQRAVGR